ncbi:ead/Ea22-like family protein [Pseudomonas kurunegalensis]|uniref:ead/Ea22-like family protein n=2 Tax=Pseudomonas TaxID=286 RepID=UPI002118C97C
MSKPDNQVNELHLREPQPGDFWHERFCPYHIVLAVTPDGVVITDKTKPDGSSHYTFDLEAAKEITHEEHARAVRYSSGNGFAADVVPARAAGSVREWKAAGSKYIPIAEQQAAPHAGEALMDTNKMRDLKAMAEAAGSDEWYAAGDLRYCDDKTGETHGLHHDDSRFIAAASPATVLALLEEIERLESAKGDPIGSFDKHMEYMQENIRLKADNEALRKLKLPHYLKLSDEMRAAGDHAELRAREDQCYSVPVLKAVFFEAAIQRWLDDQEEAIDAALAGEASHD